MGLNMANRFTDSRKWDDPWFRKLACKHKAFWIFLLDKCNHAGIWKVDMESAEFHIGDKFDIKDVHNVFRERVVDLKGKWFIPKFISFQYQVDVNSLNPDNRVHKSVLMLLQKEGALKGLKSTLLGCKDKDKDKDKDSIYIYEHRFNDFWKQYPRKLGKEKARKIFIKTVTSDRLFENIMRAVDNYRNHTEGTDEKYIKHGSTWMGEWMDWVDYKSKDNGRTKPW
jgi:hypothetical protein